MAFSMNNIIIILYTHQLISQLINIFFAKFHRNKKKPAMKSFETDDESTFFSQHMINLHVLILMITSVK